MRDNRITGEEYSRSPLFLFHWFKRQFHKVQHLYEETDDDNLTSSQMSFSENILSSNFAYIQEEEAIRLAVLMRPFLDVNSRIHYGRIWKLTKRIYRKYLLTQAIEKVEQQIDSLPHCGMPITINDKNYNAENIYNFISRNLFFHQNRSPNDDDQIALNEKILKPLYWQIFYSYNIAGYKLVISIFELMPAIENSLPYKQQVERYGISKPKCIYCLQSSGRFNSVEHVIPESLGNHEMILPKGYVCDKCNNEVLANLDQELTSFGPVAYVNVMNGPFTKAGKLPKVNTQNLTIQQKTPTKLVFIPKDRTGEVTNIEDLGNGLTSFTINMTGRIFNPIVLGRCLVKIGLGTIAFLKCNLNPYDHRFNDARDFIFARTNCFDNYLLIKTQCKPSGKQKVTLEEHEEGTVIRFDYYGLCFIFSLETTFKVSLSYVEDRENFTRYSLINGEIC